jgi:hypothetical protein
LISEEEFVERAIEEERKITAEEKEEDPKPFEDSSESESNF